MVQNQNEITHRAVVLKLLQDNTIIYDATKAFYMLSPRDIAFYVNAFIYAEIWMKNYNANGTEEGLQKSLYNSTSEKEAATLVSISKTNKEIHNILNSQFRSWNPRIWGLVCIEFSCSVIKNKLIKAPYLKEQKSVTTTTLCTMNQYTAQEKKELEILCTERELEQLRKKCIQLEKNCEQLKEENTKLKKEKSKYDERVRKAFTLIDPETYDEENIVNLEQRKKKIEDLRRNSISRRNEAIVIRNEVLKVSTQKLESK